MLFSAKSAILFSYSFHSDLGRKQTVERIKALFTMNDNLSSTEIKDPQQSYRLVIGIALIGGGALILLEAFFKTGWLSFLTLPVLALILLIDGIRSRRLLGIIPGCLIGGTGLGLLFGYGGVFNLGWNENLAILLGGFAAGWLGIVAFSRLLLKRYNWWSLLLVGIFGSLALTFAISQMRTIDFFSYTTAGIGFSMLIWGLLAHSFGLIIPGCILSGIGVGLYQAWGSSADLNGLARTGILLVIFAIGWGMITVLSRAIAQKFVWWPLIPAGVMGITGYGLYIGGSPNSAVNFIGNTGSIGLILLGLYLLLVRRGIHGGK
jgi:hypothetical protein